jgi:adenylosuccinate lyase
MIERYTLPEMGRLWSEEARLASWLEVELAACEARAARGEIPPAEMDEIRARAGYDPARVEALDREVGHDVIAFLTAVAERVGPAARHIHHGLTSSDVVDTAQALRTVRAADLLLAGLERLLGTLRARAVEHKRTVLVGRTHGVHAEPYTLGLKLAGWYAEGRRNLERLRRAREEMRHGKLSGAVGTYSH